MSSAALPESKAKLSADDLVTLVSALRSEILGIKVRPLIDSFFEWVQQARLEQKGRNLATRALAYATNQEHELRRVLADGRLPLDNAWARRTYKDFLRLDSYRALPWTVGRTSPHFHGLKVRSHVEEERCPA